MAEYIEREALLHKMKMDIRPPFAVVRDFPAADVAPVRHGRWVHDENYESWEDKYICSACNHHALTDGDYRHTLSNYCPNCGACMKGVEDEK